MDVSEFRDGRVHTINSGLKGLKRVWVFVDIETKQQQKTKTKKKKHFTIISVLVTIVLLLNNKMTELTSDTS